MSQIVQIICYEGCDAITFVMSEGEPIVFYNPISNSACGEIIARKCRKIVEKNTKELRSTPSDFDAFVQNLEYSKTHLLKKLSWINRDYLESKGAIDKRVCEFWISDN